MNIQQFAQKLSEKENQSPLFEALRALRKASMQQLHDAGLSDWTPWSGEDTPARVKA